MGSFTPPFAFLLIPELFLDGKKRDGEPFLLFVGVTKGVLQLEGGLAILLLIHRLSGFK